jgi:signal transduction histidine kinase
LLAVVALVVESTAVNGSVPRRLVLALFLAYALLALRGRSIRRFSHATPSLIVDAIFLLTCAGISAAGALALTMAVFAFLLAKGLLFHTSVQLVATAGLCLPLVLLIRSEEIRLLAPGLLIATVLALLGSRQKESLIRRFLTGLHRPTESRTVIDAALKAERLRLAADFHDGPLQSFAGLQMRLEVIRKKLQDDPAGAMKELIELQELASTQTDEIRHFIHNMGAIAIDGPAFQTALTEIVDTFREHSGIAATLICVQPIQAINPELSHAVLKIIREALHNAYKHAGASEVEVRVGRPTGEWEIGIRDNGAGFPFSGSYTLEQLDASRLGPQSIKRRIHSLGGSLTLESRPGWGSSLLVRIPE